MAASTACSARSVASICLRRGNRPLDAFLILLSLDDWGPDRLTSTQRRDLMEIVEERYGRKSTIMTSQLPVATWHDVIGEPTFADAILDRLVHNAYRIALDGPSLRKDRTDHAVEDAG